MTGTPTEKGRRHPELTQLREDWDPVPPSVHLLSGWGLRVPTGFPRSWGSPGNAFLLQCHPEGVALLSGLECHARFPPNLGFPSTKRGGRPRLKEGVCHFFCVAENPDVWPPQDQGDMATPLALGVPPPASFISVTCLAPGRH